MKPAICCVVLGLFALPALASEAVKHSGPSPAVALRELIKGNDRYVHQPKHPHQDAETRHQLVKGQHPFAAILSCSDSRVPPELVFDEGLGDIFTVRVAGNVVDDAVVGSLEYAAEHLGVPVILVLGHTQCGAVAATIKGGEPNTHIDALVKAIRPAVVSAANLKGELADNAVRENVRLAVKQLSESGPILQKLVEEGQLKIVGAIYDLDKGTVEYLK